MKLLLQIVVLSLVCMGVTVTVSARPGIPFHPCNTLIISTYSFSLHSNPINPDTNSNNPDFIFMDLRPSRRHLPFPHPHPFHHPYQRLEMPRAEMTDLPLPQLGFSSFTDRSKDILSVVASLLFGAACGALTAGTMYLVWSIVNYRAGGVDVDVDVDDVDGDYDEVDYDDGDHEVFNPKKTHYVAIPTESAVPVVAKEVDSAAVPKETV